MSASMIKFEMRLMVTCGINNLVLQSQETMLSGSLVTTAWHTLRLWMEEMAFKYGE